MSRRGGRVARRRRVLPRPAPRVAFGARHSERMFQLSPLEAQALFYFGRSDVLLRCMEEGVTFDRIESYLAGLVRRFLRLFPEP